MSRNLTIWILSFVISVAIGWSMLTTLPSSTIAMGEVVPEGGIINVMYNQNGIISKLFVKEGSIVKEGDPIVALEPFEQEVDKKTILRRIDKIKVDIARYEAERDSLKSVKWPKVDATIIDDAKALHQAKMSRRLSSINRFKALIESQETELKTLSELIKSRQNIVDNIKTKLDGYYKLLKKGTITKMRVLDEESALAKAQSDLASANQSYNEAKSRIISTKSQLDMLKQSFAEETFQNLQDARSKLAELVDLNNKLTYRKEKMIVRANKDGIIKTINIHSGEVVNSNTIIAIIVPNSKLMIEAKLRVSEIGYVYENQLVDIRLSGPRSSRFNFIKGEVQSISADTIQDKKGNVFYRVYIKPLNNKFTDKTNDKNAYPLVIGMRVQNMILTGKQTVLEHVFGPLLNTASYAMVER